MEKYLVTDDNESTPFSVTEKWVPPPLELPTGGEVFTDLRAKADAIFANDRMGPDADAVIDSEMLLHVIETGETQLTCDADDIVNQQQAEQKEQEEAWAEETADKIEMARDEVCTLQEDLRQQGRDVEMRLREEEVAARDRLVYEHQAMEAEMLRTLRRSGGYLQTVSADKFSWTVEWDRAPQEFNVNVTSIRGLRSKLRDGYYVIMASVVDIVGGKTLRFSTGRDNIDCSGCLPPIRILENSAAVDRFINLGMNLKCPAPLQLQTYACLVFEIWQLRVGNHDRTDKVVGWAVWPLVGKDFRVVEGRFCVPMIRGDVDSSVDTYRHLTHSLQQDLKAWLGNLYFEIEMNRSDHSILQARYETLEQQLENNNNLELMEVNTLPSRKQDKLRLEKTVDDHKKLIVPKLPPRLFFDDVALGNEGSQGLRRRYFGSDDLRPLNAALWEKRAMLEEEREALAIEMTRKSRKKEDSQEEVDRNVREILTRSKNHVLTDVYRHYPETNFARSNEDDFLVKDKVTDSHVLLFHHHSAIAAQREFVFLGRRYRDRLAIMANILLYDMGVNFAGNWDKSKLVISVAYLIIGLIMRNIVHNVVLWSYLNLIDVPLTVNSWNALHVNIQFEFKERFYPFMTLLTMFVGALGGMSIFLFFGISLKLLLLIFQWVPYFMTRFFFWFGFAVFLDPFISVATSAAIANTETGDSFILLNQLSREEGSPLSGWLMTISTYGCLMILQAVALYWYACAVHLNGRVNDIYDRIMFPNLSFFIPHDLEVSERELNDVVKEAKKYRDEQRGTVKRVRVADFDHHYTCYFRARLYKLLSIWSENASEWISEYIDSIPLRRPIHSKKLIKKKLGSYQLGSDIIYFLRRHFPHLTVMSDYRVGDMEEDSYYEAELLRSVQMNSTVLEDDTEMRGWLKAYFKAQIDGPKPARWAQTVGNAEDGTLRTPFVVDDWQLLADLIFFETSGSSARSLALKHYFSQDKKARKFEEPDAPNVYALSNFVHEDPTLSTQGDPALGAIIQIYREFPSRGTKELSRVFVVTPFGSIVEPNRTSFALMEHHTADDTEYWAAKAMDTIDEADKIKMEAENINY